jgi:hypothetical protein
MRWATRCARIFTNAIGKAAADPEVRVLVVTARGAASAAAAT